MRRIPPPVLAGVAVLDVVTVVGAQLLYPAGALDVGASIMFSLAVASLAGVGAFLAIRVSANRIGWLLLGAGTLLAISNLGGAYSIGGQASPTAHWPGVPIAAWLANVLFVIPIVIVITGVPAVFPDGHLPSRRWRWLPILLVVGTTLALLQPAFQPGPFNESEIVNPFGVPGLESWLPIANTVSALTAIPAFLGAFAALTTRFRRGTSAERHQIKWLLAVASVGAIAFPAAFNFPDSIVGNVLFYLGFGSIVALPVAIGIAILRYRLYEIDRIISRTLGWSVVTAILVASFAMIVVGLQAVLGGVTQGETLAVAGSTLAAFALVQPLHRRVQRVVDRRFNRSRVNAERTLVSFGERVRDEVDLAHLRGAVIGAADEAVRPAEAGLWLRTRGRA